MIYTLLSLLKLQFEIIEYVISCYDVILQWERKMKSVKLAVCLLTLSLLVVVNGLEGKKKNWIPTGPKESWFSWFRLCGPLQPHFDRSWVLPDFEKIK